MTNPEASHQDNREGLFAQFYNRFKEQVTPENEVLASAAYAYMCLVIMIDPDSLPPEVQSLIDLITQADVNFQLWVATAFGFLGSADGVRRMVLERFPLYKAYLQVFLLNKIE